jgi:hypothetical protein
MEARHPWLELAILPALRKALRMAICMSPSVVSCKLARF